MLERILRKVFPQSWAEHDKIIEDLSRQRIQYEAEAIILDELKRYFQDNNI